MSQEMGWHFVGKTLRDGRGIPAVGEELTHDGALVMCEAGLHYSRTPFEALQYAPGEFLCKVTVRGYEYAGDKGVAKSRTILQILDVTETLRDFACSEALAVLPSSAPAIVREYLTTRNEGLRDAARGAAWDAARDAARDAAWNAARDAARGAARDAARGAAWDAARDAAWDAAWGAARLRQAATFNEAIYRLFAV